MMQKLRAQVELLAKPMSRCSLSARAGAGKDTVASLIHKLSVRSGFKFLRVNCAAHARQNSGDRIVRRRGACSGSGRRVRENLRRAKKVRFCSTKSRRCRPRLQIRLMQVLQDVLPDRQRRSSHAVDVRILATTSANIDRALAEKRLREDLYYRLSAFTIQVPPLRQRRMKSPTLCGYFMHNLARHYGLPPREFSPRVLAACQRYPGRET